MRRAVGDSRVSTETQSREGVSLNVQQERIRAWATANDYELGEVYVDAGISGSRADNRPGLQAALKDACNDGSALVVYSLSRLARSTKDAISIAEKLDTAHADLVSLTERIDTTSATGKLVFRILAVLSEFERDLISERTSTALAHKRAQGERISRYLPYGWDLAADGVNLVENSAEQEVASWIRDCRQSGWPLRAIAAELNNRGIPAKQGGRWNHQSILGVLQGADRKLVSLRQRGLLERSAGTVVRLHS